MLEGSPRQEMRRADIPSDVLEYADNLEAQLDQVVSRYGIENFRAIRLRSKLERDQFIKDLSAEDFELWNTLFDRHTSAIQDKKIPTTDRNWKQREIGEKIEAAAEIMGKDFFGPQAVEKTFGLKLEAKDIPPIPFSKAELERAKELGQFLILRVDKAPDGQPLTMKKMEEMLTPRFRSESKGKIRRDDNTWHLNEDFYTKETPTLRWALASKDIIPNSHSKNYVEQTEQVVNYLKTQVFKDQPIPQYYQEAIQEFESKKVDLAKRIIDNNTWKKAAKELEQLKLSELTRQTPVEALYDTLIRFDNTGERHLPGTYAWTRRRASDGYLVLVGYFVPDGAHVNRWLPVHTSGGLGVLLAR